MREAEKERGRKDGETGRIEVEGGAITKQQREECQRERQPNNIFNRKGKPVYTFSREREREKEREKAKQHI